MNDLNNVILTGRVTRDVELKYTTSGTAVANFSIAVNEGVKQSDGRWEDVANFFEITLWGKQAETMSRFLTKGKQVSVQGRLKHQTWQDQQTGQNRSKVTVNAQFIQLLSSPDGGNGRHDGEAGNSGRNYGAATPQRRPATHREPQSAAARYSSPIESDDDAVPPELFLDDDIPF